MDGNCREQSGSVHKVILLTTFKRRLRIFLSFTSPHPSRLRPQVPTFRWRLRRRRHPPWNCPPFYRQIWNEIWILSHCRDADVPRISIATSSSSQISTWIWSVTWTETWTEIWSANENDVCEETESGVSSANGIRTGSWNEIFGNYRQV